MVGQFLLVSITGLHIGGPADGRQTLTHVSHFLSDFQNRKRRGGAQLAPVFISGYNINLASAV